MANNGQISQPNAGYSWDKTAKLSRKYRHLRSQLIRLRVELEAAVVARFGRQPTLHESAVITAAVRHEAVARMAEERLAKDPGMAVSDLNALLGRIGYASDNLRKAIASLGLDRQELSVLDSYYAGTHGIDAAEHSEAGSAHQSDSSPDATEGQLGPLNAMPQNSTELQQ